MLRFFPRCRSTAVAGEVGKEDAVDKDAVCAQPIASVGRVVGEQHHLTRAAGTYYYGNVWSIMSVTENIQNDRLRCLTAYNRGSRPEMYCRFCKKGQADTVVYTCK